MVLLRSELISVLLVEVEKMFLMRIVIVKLFLVCSVVSFLNGVLSWLLRFLSIMLFKIC